jgi:hypothetical protein
MWIYIYIYIVVHIRGITRCIYKGETMLVV